MKMHVIIKAEGELLGMAFFQSDHKVGKGENRMNFLILMLQLYKGWLRLGRDYFPHTDVPIDGVYDFCVIIQIEDLRWLKEAVYESYFILV